MSKAANLPTDPTARKNAPMDRGLLRYFPRALAYVAEVSRIGNEQHNPGQPMHWAKEKSTDHGDCIVRHQCDAGSFDGDGVRHSGKVAWRALAQLETELEEAAAPVVAAPAPAHDVPPHVLQRLLDANRVIRMCGAALPPAVREGAEFDVVTTQPAVEAPLTSGCQHEQYATATYRGSVFCCECGANLGEAE